MSGMKKIDFAIYSTNKKYLYVKMEEEGQCISGMRKIDVAIYSANKKYFYVKMGEECIGGD